MIGVSNLHSDIILEISSEFLTDDQLRAESKAEFIISWREVCEVNFHTSVVFELLACIANSWF